MDQFAREEKRSIKKRNHKNNRKNAKYFLKNNDYDSALEWIDLNEKSK